MWSTLMNPRILDSCKVKTGPGYNVMVVGPGSNVGPLHVALPLCVRLSIRVRLDDPEQQDTSTSVRPMD